MCNNTNIKKNFLDSLKEETLWWILKQWLKTHVIKYGCAFGGPHDGDHIHGVTFPKTAKNGNFKRFCAKNYSKLTNIVQQCFHNR